MRPTSAATLATPLPKTPGGISLHRQLYLVLRDGIRRAEWKPGEALPGEEALCEQFGVSRITVRRALADLVSEGLIERRHGRGSFVLGAVNAKRPQVTLGFLAGLRKTVLETQVQVLKVERIAAPTEVAEQLQLAEGDRVVHALRLRHRRDVPLMVTEAWVPESVGSKVSVAALKKRALYELLLEQGLKFGRVVQEITAQIADPWSAQLLNVPAGSPLLVLVRLIHDQHAKPIQYLRVSLSAERSRILMDIGGDDINTLTAGQVVHDTSPKN